MIVRDGVKIMNLINLNIGDEFEFYNSRKAWRVIEKDGDSVLCRYLNGSGNERWMSTNPKVYKIIYKQLPPTSLHYANSNENDL